ncbi:Plectin [Eumeta japonica]|uniref:Plectin n=1 Tax=Eumeta variegata TaxID=151549 RepID=A0A4C2A6S3_EUMVA|nr:Plectin [Eumeta japonica]
MNVFNSETILVKNLSNGKYETLTYALERPLLDRHTGHMVDPKTGKKIPFFECVARNWIIRTIPEKGKPAAIENVIDPATGKVKLDNGRVCSIVDAINNGLLDIQSISVRDPVSGEVIPLRMAIELGVVDMQAGTVIDIQTLKEIPMEDAFKLGFLVPGARKPISLEAAVRKGLYDPETDFKSTTGEEILLQQAIEHGFVELDTCLVKDDERHVIVPGKQAAKEGLLDTVKGCLNSPHIKLNEAFVKGYLISTKKPLSLVDCLLRGLYDPSSAKFKIDDKRVDLKNAISLKLINADELVLLDPKTESIISLTEAINKGYIDPVRGFVINPFAGTKLSLDEALENRILIPPKRKRSLPDAVYRGLYDPKTGEFSNTITREKLSTERAIRRGILDPDSTIVKVAGEILPFEKAALAGIVDGQRGTVKDNDDKPIDFKEAFDRGVLLEAKKPLRLIEAVIKNVYDEADGSFMDPKTGLKLSFAEAVETNLLDDESVQIRDFNTGLYKQLNLVHATVSGVIDGKNAKLVYNNQKITIKHAFDVGILIDVQAPLSLQRALHQGLDDRTGKLTDPKSGRKITLLESIRSFVINPQLPCYFDELQEQMRLRRIRSSRSSYKRTNSFEQKALSLELVMRMQLFRPESGKFCDPTTGEFCDLAEAIQNGFIDPATTIFKNHVTGKELPLNEAIINGDIDVAKGRVFDPKTKSAFNYDIALTRGILVTITKPLTERTEIVKRQESVEFLNQTPVSVVVSKPRNH